MKSQIVSLVACDHVRRYNTVTHPQYTTPGVNLDNFTRSIKDLAAEVADVPVVQGKLTEFANRMDAANAALAAAVAANTPAA